MDRNQHSGHTREKNNYFLKTLIFWLAISITTPTFSQEIDSGILYQFKDNIYFNDLITFYQLNHQSCYWNNDSKISRIQELLQTAEYNALDPKRYHLQDAHMETSVQIKDIQYSLLAISFLHDLEYGYYQPEFDYHGINYPFSSHDIGRKAFQALERYDFKQIISDIKPANQEYTIALAYYRKLLENRDFETSEMQIKSQKSDNTNQRLIERLFLLGLTPTLHTQLAKEKIILLIQEAQQMFNLEPDGRLENSTIHAMNVPLKYRIEALKEYINFIRWSGDLKLNKATIILNIPSADLKFYEGGLLQLYSKVIVGKAKNKTPTLTSVIEEIILYPYWNVPYNIASRELLPIIKRNPHYLESSNFQVLNKSGKIVSPHSINWHSLSSYYFPYQLRQSTGCDNSLGIIKFNFNNPFSVYLHDTPNKELFKKRQRFFSHGCMRVEKPIELGRLLLGENKIAIDTLTEKGCLLQQSPIVIPSKMKPILVVHYSTVGFSKDGKLCFFEDIYEKTKQ